MAVPRTTSPAIAVHNDGGAARDVPVPDASDRTGWFGGGVEPTIAELLSDFIVQSLMHADGVAVEDVMAAIGQAGTAHRHRPKGFARVSATAACTLKPRLSVDNAIGI